MTHNYPLVTYNNLLCSIGINYEYLTHRLGGVEYKFQWLAAEVGNVQNVPSKTGNGNVPQKCGNS